jgi:hypothetical protein
MTMQVDESIVMYQVGCFIIFPTYLPTPVTLWLSKTMLQWPNWRYCNSTRKKICSILLFCNNQIGLVVIILFHLFHPHNIYGHIDNIIFNPIHTCITLIKLMQIHWTLFLLCNTHAQDNIFHLIWFKNAIIRLFWSYAIPSCLGYILYHLIE